MDEQDAGTGRDEALNGGRVKDSQKGGGYDVFIFSGTAETGVGA